MPGMPPTEPAEPLRLTSNEARARDRRTTAALAARAAGQTVWQAPAIAVRERWLFDQWAGSWPDEQLLSPAQELAQWRALIADDPATTELVSTAGLARSLRTADRLIHVYGIDVSQAPAWTPEQAAFATWQATLARRRADAGELTAAQIPAAFSQQVRDGRIPIPAALMLDHGSAHHLPPNQHAAIATLRDAGCRVQRPEAGPPATTLRARHYPDAEAELRAAAADIADWLPPDADDAPGLLVVAVDDVAARRPAIDAVFTDVLAPWRLTLGNADAPAPWRFEPAGALTGLPLAAAALDLIGLRARDNPFATISRLLLSAALWTPEQRLAAATAEVQVRQHAAPRIHLRDLAHLAPPAMREAWQQLRACVDDEPRRAPPSTWSTHFKARLSAMGWGAVAQRDSAAWQTARQVHEALGQLTVLDRQLGDIGAAAAAGWVAELMDQRAFAPRVDAIQPIVICDYATAAELPCAARWVLGATDAVMPPRVGQQPFIAREVLVQAQVPGADADATLAAARTLANALCRDADTVTVSHCLLDANGAELRPSPLFDPPGGWQAAGAPPRPHVAARLANDPEAPLPAVGDAEAEGVRGGTSILRSCAASLFGAMVRHRLGVEALEEPAAGLDGMTQGSVIHAVLADVWTELGDAAALAACPPPALAQRVRVAVDAQLDKAMPAWRYPALVIAAERARLVRLITAWMDHERRRTDDFTVLAHERSADLVFEGLPLTVRVDRLDAVHTDLGPRHLIIDYKTGRKIHPGGWDADRLAEPQLPLYAAPEVTAALGITAADGIAFAHVHANQRALAAATNWTARLIDGDKVIRKPEQFTALLDATHARLRELTRAFLAGEAGWQPGELANDPLAVLVREPIDDEAGS